ncbi:MAG TPA: GvpL/GvpF family gas vesicle protein [Acidimicrobiales bacterium]|jgi:hypothetical protein|nr:GvpL/GvpF family gas vesicle protein [Acidimicrobiales bacterium]
MPDQICVYAVVPSATDNRRLTSETGIDGCPLELVECGPLAALVSPVQSERLRPTRAALTAHEQVTATAHQIGPCIPVRFGTLFPDRQSVERDLLTAQRSHLDSLIHEVENRDEYRLRARYLANVALTEVVARSREVQRFRRKLNGGPAPQAAQIQLGELVVAGLEALRDEDAEAVMNHISPYMVAGRRLPDRAEDTAVHLALLVDRTRGQDLERAVEQLGGAQRGRLHIDLVGPLAPWDFTLLETGAA